MLYRPKQWKPEDEDICIFRDCNIHVLKNILFELWNLLPVSIRSAQTISSFKLLLKTYLLTQAFNLSECWVLCSLCLFVCVVLCLCLCIFMKMVFVCCCFLWLFGFLFLYSTLGNNGCIILCYRNKWMNELMCPLRTSYQYFWFNQTDELI